MIKSTQADARIAQNVGIHDQLAEHYDRNHPEIFNPIEQARLHATLGEAVAAAKTEAGTVRALDMGCGTGNLTHHLVALGCDVTAADVSSRFLTLIEERFGAATVKTSRLNGIDLSQFPDRSFDLIATYSVLHHIPDYLHAVAEMGRVCAVGGIVYIDHESTEESWQPNPVYDEFRKQADRTDWRKFLRPVNYYGKIRRLFDPKFANEGDIHVWPDDHIEWTAILNCLGSDFAPVIDNCYLHANALYRPEVFDHYRERLTDMRVMGLRRIR